MEKLIVVLLILNLLAKKKTRKKYETDDELRINGQKPLVLKKIVSELTRTLLIKGVITEKEWANIMGNSEENDPE